MLQPPFCIVSRFIPKVSSICWIFVAQSVAPYSRTVTKLFGESSRIFRKLVASLVQVQSLQTFVRLRARKWGNSEKRGKMREKLMKRQAKYFLGVQGLRNERKGFRIAVEQNEICLGCIWNIALSKYLYVCSERKEKTIFVRIDQHFDYFPCKHFSLGIIEKFSGF